MYMKGLEDVIGLSVVHPTWARYVHNSISLTETRTKPSDPEDDHAGWWFKNPTDAPVSNLLGFNSYDCSDCIPDTVNGKRKLPA